jgi:hypothetical protein
MSKSTDVIGYHKAEPMASLASRLDAVTLEVAAHLPVVLHRLSPTRSVDGLARVMTAVLDGPVYRTMPSHEALAEFLSRLSWELGERGMVDELVAAFWATVREIQSTPRPS